MKKEIIDFLRSNHKEIHSDWQNKMEENRDQPTLRITSENGFFMMSQEFINLLLGDSLGYNTLNDKLPFFIEKTVSYNWPLSFLVKGIQVFEQVILGHLEKSELGDKDNAYEQVRLLDAWLHPLCQRIVEVYSNTWERTFSLQKIALQELSAPLIPVFDGITIMPLVGTIDTQRAKHIMENLLHGVVKHRSEVVLIDITGVPVVDTMVAHHIIQAVQAVRLVGTKSMIVGIRPEIAQTIVNLGIKLDQFETKNTLKKGMEKALEYTNRKLVEIGE